MYLVRLKICYQIFQCKDIVLAFYMQAVEVEAESQVEKHIIKIIYNRIK